MGINNDLTEAQIKELGDIVLTELGDGAVSYRKAAAMCMEIFEDLPGFDRVSDGKQQETIDEVWKHISTR